MKKTIAFLISIAILIACIGCKSNTFVIQEPAEQNNTQQLKSSNFNQTHYIWENWFFTTNKVNVVK